MSRSAPANGAILECREVGRTFTVGAGLFAAKRPLRAVEDVDLAVERGEVLAIVGESGCGKTTLARMMLGLLAPSRGVILFAGTPIHEIDRNEVARRVQPVFQDPYSSLNPRKTLEDIIALPLVVHRIGTPEERRKRVEQLMELVGLSRRLIYAYPSQLSGGQRQRVAIARALAINPELVVCDEPTSALDVSVQAQILNLLQDLRRELNLTFVIISHNLAVVEHMADRVAVMYLGRVIEQGTTADIFDRPRHPYTQTLLESALTPDPTRGLPEFALGTDFPNPLDPPSGCAFHPRCPKAMAECSQTRPETLREGGKLVECHLYGTKARGPARLPQSIPNGRSGSGTLSSSTNIA
jgi:peptide/nickel transport system ATP-binding protein